MRDETNFLTKIEYERLLDAIPRMKMFLTDHKAEPVPMRSTEFRPDDLRLLFKVIYEGALRVSEAISLTPDDLIIDGRVIKLEGTKGTKKAKRKQKREFANVKSDTFDELVRRSKRMHHEKRLFPVHRVTVWRWIKEIGEIASISLYHEAKDTTNVTVHTLRHSRALHFVESGQPINVVQKKLRHRSLQPTTTYLNININKLKEVEDDI